MSILLIVHLCPLYLRCCFYRNVLIQKETVTKWLYELAWIYTPRLNYRVGVEVLIKKGLFFYDICTTKTHRKRGSFIVCCFLILVKKNLNSSVNLNSKAPSIRRSESRIVVADVSVVLSTPMSKNTRKRRFFTPSTHIKNVCSSIITEDSSVLWTNQRKKFMDQKNRRIGKWILQFWTFQEQGYLLFEQIFNTFFQSRIKRKNRCDSPAI